MQKGSTTMKLVDHATVFPEGFPANANVRMTAHPDPLPMLHRHQYFEIGYCHSGAGGYMVGSRFIPFVAGDAVALCGQEYHMWGRCTDDEPTMWTIVRVDVAAMLDSISGVDDHLLDTNRLLAPEYPRVLSSEEYPEPVGIIHRIAEEMAHRQSDYRSLVRVKILELMISLHRHFGAGRTRVHTLPDQAVASRVNPALEHIACNYGNTISIPDLAERCGLKPLSFRRAFRRATGKLPHAYLTAVRVDMAARTLRSSERPIGQIALDTGFATLSSFNRSFRKLTGMSPGEWRRG